MTSVKLQCSDYGGNPDINFRRICKAGGCCDPVRSATNHCHIVYKLLGESMAEACSDCCSPGKTLAPAPPPNPKYPPIDCTLVDRPDRICKATSCCEPTLSSSRFCTDIYQTYGDSIGSVCWNCCSEPKEVDPDLLPNIPMTSASTSPPELEITGSSESNFAPILPPSERQTSPPREMFQCSDYDDNADINFRRICKSGGCCDSIRSASDHCHFAYKFFGDNMSNVCSDCCTPGKKVAPAPPTNPKYPPIDCTLVDRPERICKPSSCCEPEKSTTKYCNDVYKEYGTSIGSVCWHCCAEPKEVDQSLISAKALMAPPVLGRSEEDSDIIPVLTQSLRVSSHSPAFPSTAVPSGPTIMDDVMAHPVFSNEAEDTSDELFSLIKSPTAEPTVNPTSSLYPTEELSTNPSDQINTLPTEGIVTTSEPTNDPEPVRRRLRAASTTNTEASDEKERAVHDILLPSGIWVSDLTMDPENFEVSPNLEEEYMASIHEYDNRQKESKEQRRRLHEKEPLHGDNYVNTAYSPYEWMREVRTEYYYRYEGTLVVPPCYETVHWRIMKDPIRIHPDQLKELERLLAWRISPKGSQFNECQRDTAGRERPDSNGDAVDLNRPIQQYSPIHRKTFCECKDWDSKFIEDRQWCESGDYEYRLYQHPYNFESKGFEP
eukprot:CAMPEP_0202446566 /NCGR_PEP_ID=MMETSP1360-20130828/5081_1 /ASSEMBLY_ACC=CAM_ASM_000848 /TAXON_ID=515479 /ORGANISM="Licmophora paradoxa, Strain CCMP2313" /LENGTH=661 /DNA_ID=CAMNT_0049063119 /DNA_START=209 /DNA_END=2194 /DNA_ORIENTATION=+